MDIRSEQAPSGYTEDINLFENLFAHFLNKFPKSRLWVEFNRRQVKIIDLSNTLTPGVTDAFDNFVVSHGVISDTVNSSLVKFLPYDAQFGAVPSFNGIALEFGSPGRLPLP